MQFKDIINRVLRPAILSLALVCSSSSLNALKGDIDGLTEETRSIMLAKPTSKIVYYSALKGLAPDQVPEGFSPSEETVINASVDFLRDQQKISDWSNNPLRKYVSHAFFRIGNKEYENRNIVIMNYVKSDFEDNPANNFLFESNFLGGDIPLIQTYTNYVFSIMDKNLTLQEMDKRAAGHVEIIAEIVRILANLNDPSALDLGENIANQLAGKFTGNDRAKVINKLSDLLGADFYNPKTLPSSPVSEVQEITQESTEPEPATEKPSQIKTSEPSEESAKQSSNWWLWLIGAVVVIGGLGLALRRKS